jgi:hypothetical protein
MAKARLLSNSDHYAPEVQLRSLRISLLRVTRDWMGNAVILVPWRALQGATVWTFAMCEVTLEYPGVEDAADEFTRTQVNSRLTHSFCLASTYC